MIKEAFGTAPTVDEAREKAEQLLRAQNIIDDSLFIDFEIIDMPKAKTLGIFGGKDAKVRVFIELPDENKAKPRAEKPAKQATKKNTEKPQKAEKAPKAPKVEKAEKPVAEAAAEEVAESTVAVPAEQIDKNSRAGKAVTYLEGILVQLGCTDIKMMVAESDNGAEIKIEGENMGTVIGYRGETLDALQYLASVASNAKGAGYYRVVINIGNYREKRVASLEGLAKKTAAQAIRSRRNRSLEPMNPYERRIVHTAIQGIEGVTSKSVGEGSRRHIVIVPDNAERRPRPAKAHESAGSAPAQTETTAKKTDAGNMPLYGRIDK